MLTADGRIFAFGGAVRLADSAAVGYQKVDIEATPSGQGYWVLSSAGTVDSFGDAQWFGGRGYDLSLARDELVVSMSATPTGRGYWLFSDKGRVFAFGDAKHLGDMSGVRLNGPVLDSVASPSGNGYWMVASDGGVFSFGDARFYGSMGGTKLNQPVISLAPDPDGIGYWLVAKDGGIFAFDAPFFGSTGNIRLNKPISGMVGQPGGYLMVAEDGGIFAFGSVDFHGSLGANPPSSPVVAVAALDAAPVMEFHPVMQAGGFANTDTTVFSLSSEIAKLTWTCDAHRASSSGCHFRVVDFLSGDWLDTVSADPDQSGTLYLHPERPGAYYIEAYEFGSNTEWRVSLEQLRCVANCEGVPEPPPLPVMTWRPVMQASGFANTNTATFNLSTTVAELKWSCDSHRASSSGCHFRVTDFLSGDWLDTVSADPDQSGTLYLHPDRPGAYYIEAHEFGSDTSWSVSIKQ